MDLIFCRADWSSWIFVRGREVHEQNSAATAIKRGVKITKRALIDSEDTGMNTDRILPWEATLPMARFRRGGPVTDARAQNGKR